MKTPALSVLALVLVACGSPKTPADAEKVETTSAALTVPQEKQAEAEPKAPEPGEAAPAAGAAPKALDPLAEDDSIASIPKIERTPAKEIRARSRGDLEAAMALAKRTSTLDAAAAAITKRAGKPSWIENGQRRVWVAKDGARCHKLVLDTDGSLDLETAQASDWKMLSAMTQQNECTGEIKRGMPGK